MQKSSHTSGFSIVLALGLTILLSITGLYILEYIVPFSQNIKGVENASSSFYEAYSGIEDALFLQSNNITGYQTGTTFGAQGRAFQYDIFGTGNDSPRQGLGEGTSEYNTNYNRISSSDPAQFLVGSNRINTATGILRLEVKVPDIHQSTLDSLNVTTNDPIILWQLSSTGNSLTAGSPILESEINLGFTGQLMTRTGTLLDGTPSNFTAFYVSNCNSAGRECVLKISVINPLVSTLIGSPKIPYLEYRLYSNAVIPLRSAIVSSQGKSYGFSKKLKIQVPQTTTNAAFNFTVFQ